MNEYPVFVPVGNVHVAAVVAVPEHARGVVLLTTGGGGVGRSHRYAMWTKVARRLAEKDIASVRMEWPGIGDSTGDPLFDFRRMPLAEVAAVSRLAIEATGADRLGMVGNCAGARTILRAAANGLRCDSVVVFLLKPLSTGGSHGVIQRRSRALASRLPRWVRRLPRNAYRAVRPTFRQTAVIKQNLLALHGRADLLMMEPPAHLAADLPRFAASIQGTVGGRRTEFRELPSTTMQGFSSPEKQAFLIDTIVDWFDGSFPSRGGDRVAAGEVLDGA